MIEIIIDKEEEKKTIGVIENGKLIEVYEENKENKHERNEGNIYVGIVKDIIPGMQAAFIDIGTEKNSFIHVRDIMPQIDEKIERKEEKKIKDLVKPKQKLLVQVQKDSNDKKGARTTTHIKLTGKYVILLPQTTIVTVSQKIQDETEKNRLINVLTNKRVKIFDTNSFNEAQVTSGGVDLSDVNPYTLESRLVSGLYFAGEILDIDGDCGGYNLTIAFVTALIAGGFYDKN